MELVNLIGYSFIIRGLGAMGSDDVMLKISGDERTDPPSHYIKFRKLNSLSQC